MRQDAAQGATATATAGGLRLVTYNVHGGIGKDGRYTPERTANVIAETGADIIALQEVVDDERGNLFATLTTQFHGFSLEGITIDGPQRRYGNLLLSRWPIIESAVVDLAHPKREPRNAIRALIETPSGPFQVIATHFGLSQHERLRQVALITQIAHAHGAVPLAIAGDFNDWNPWSRVGRMIRNHRGLGLHSVPRLRTFPARFPLLALDRVLLRPPSCLIRTSVHRSDLSRIASDHLPLIAEVSLAGSEIR
jgi:endonuclease/exonuclease/phosphatase family metal-dependent hydrolase